MPRRLMCWGLCSATIIATMLYQLVNALATTTEGYKTTLLALGRFSEVDVSQSVPHGQQEQGHEQLWHSLQATKGSSDVYVQSNVWAPGGSTGWHSHPGHSLIIVTTGTVTDYEGHDPACQPHVYKTGTAFADPGGDHIHILRNEGTVEARTITVQFITENAARRIDVADPGNCHF